MPKPLFKCLLFLITGSFGWFYFVTIPGGLAQCCVAPSVKVEKQIVDPRGVDFARAMDAHRLIRDGAKLLSQSSELQTRAEHLSAEEPTLQGSVHENTEQFRSYTDLLLAYHDALTVYLQHRTEVQQHAAEFHQQAQIQKMLDVPLDVVPFKPIHLTALDQCGYLQVQEARLTQMEFALRDGIAALTSEQGHLPLADFQARMGGARSLALQDEKSAVEFENGVQDKSVAATSSLHSKIHDAYDSGDYVFFQNIYKQGQVRENVINQEMERAQMHTNLAHAFLAKLGVVNASADPAVQSAGALPAGSFANADAELDCEYQKVQQLYARVEAARSNHK